MRNVIRYFAIILVTSTNLFHMSTTFAQESNASSGPDNGRDLGVAILKIAKADNNPSEDDNEQHYPSIKIKSPIDQSLQTMSDMIRESNNLLLALAHLENLSRHHSRIEELKSNLNVEELLEGSKDPDYALAFIEKSAESIGYPLTNLSQSLRQPHEKARTKLSLLGSIGCRFHGRKRTALDRWLPFHR
jgi:hypothetical protein